MAKHAINFSISFVMSRNNASYQSPTLPCGQANLIVSTAYSLFNTVPLVLVISSLFHTQLLQISNRIFYLKAPYIWNVMPAHLRQPTSPAPINGFGLLAFSRQTIPGTAQNLPVPSMLPTWLSMGIVTSVPVVFNVAHPLTCLSVTMVEARLLA